MIEYFSEQLKNLNSDKQLVCYIMHYSDNTSHDPQITKQIRMTVHPDYHEIKDLTFVGMNGNIPVFKNA
jgi:hypothetical protein